MKKMLRVALLLACVLAVNLGTVYLLTDHLPISVAGTGESDCVLGDVNDDGIASVADPIYLLNWLFGDGPDPVACAQSGDSAHQFQLPDPSTLIARAGFEEDIDLGDRVEIYEVPAGQVLYLHMLHAQARRSASSGSGWQSRAAEVEVYRGDDQVALTGFYDYRWQPKLETGFIFGPGDTIEVETNVDPITFSGELGDLGIVWHFVGQLVPEGEVPARVGLTPTTDDIVQVGNIERNRLDDAGDKLAIYEVPKGRRLIVTDMQIGWTTVLTDMADISFLGVEPAHRVIEEDGDGELIEAKSSSRFSSTDFIERVDLFACHESNAYLTFGPESSVVIEREISGHPDEDGDADEINRYYVTYQMCGYLIDEN